MDSNVSLNDAIIDKKAVIIETGNTRPAELIEFLANIPIVLPKISERQQPTTKVAGL